MQFESPPRWYDKDVPESGSGRVADAAVFNTDEPQEEEDQAVDEEDQEAEDQEAEDQEEEDDDDDDNDESDGSKKNLLHHDMKRE